MGRLHPSLALSAVAIVCFAALTVPVSCQIRPSDTTQGYLANYGIDVEETFATTDDGYILRLFRLPRPGAPVVILQHGILASSWCWLVNTPERSLGIILWRAGYDVWLTNSRGNIFSRNHTKLRPGVDENFWNYTFNDMANYDVFTNIKHVLGSTQKAQLSFVGWSQGSTQMLVAATGPKKAFIEQHVNLFVALSPVTYMTHQKSKLIGLVSRLRLGFLLSEAWPFGFLGAGELPVVAEWFCKVTDGALCRITVDVLCGSSSIDSLPAIENLTSHFPAGTSTKDLNHYDQFVIKNRFGRYDYGRVANQEHYNQRSPPMYPLHSLAVKTALFMGTHDDLADAADTQHLQADLENNTNLVFAKEYQGYSHLSWLVGGDFAWTDTGGNRWLNDLQPLLQKYNPLPTSSINI